MPKTAARPATLGACQVRLQLSMLFEPMTMRANFWAAKFISLVLFEQLKRPNDCGPCAPTTALQSRRRAVERLVPGRGPQLCRRGGRAPSARSIGLNVPCTGV